MNFLLYETLITFDLNLRKYFCPWFSTLKIPLLFLES